MNYTITIANDAGNTVATTTVAADAVIGALASLVKVAPMDALPRPLSIRDKQPAERQSTAAKPKKTEKTTMEDAAKRSRLDPAITTEVENRLIDGETVSQICDSVAVSAPTVYVIKARLKKERRLGV